MYINIMRIVVGHKTLVIMWPFWFNQKYNITEFIHVSHVSTCKLSNETKRFTACCTIVEIFLQSYSKIVVLLQLHIFL